MIKSKVKDDFKFDYKFWHDNTYVITNRYKDVLNDYYVSEIVNLNFEDYFEIMVCEFNATYISTHGYVDKLVFKNLEDAFGVLEWLNSTLLLQKMLNP